MGFRVESVGLTGLGSLREPKASLVYYTGLLRGSNVHVLVDFDCAESGLKTVGLPALFGKELNATPKAEKRLRNPLQNPNEYTFVEPKTLKIPVEPLRQPPKP